MTTEHDELLRMLDDQRRVFRIAMRDLSEADARKRTTVSELTLGGLLKHLVQGERAYTHIITGRPGTPDGMLDTGQYVWEGGSFEELLSSYTEAARATDEAVRAASLDALVAMPSAPWDPNPEPWPVRRIVLHVLRETAQHSGHADIIREALDGASTTDQLFS
ncbi:DinB family protein [Lentzea sp. BCCO 10_0856]|uniref:DinB family protein n=1 Tax=Lentzea miocenica TaxID=3095431 RepID=A0ABU4SXS2_9PSEU|nr:DinB family protein [Lentzea sp. BCCO 10_0856]MDX8030690.1 DinB family protein [Lentzea sp. BCCO 10_0856]